MKNLFLVMVILMFFSCNSCNKKAAEKQISVEKDSAAVSQKLNAETTKTDFANEQKPIQNDADLLIADFRNFRDAVYRQDKQAVKKFIDFPISEHSIGFDIAPVFEEADFENKYSEIFPQDFTDAILKIKTEKLFKERTFTTPILYSKKSDLSFRCIAGIIDKKILQLNIQYNGDDELENITLSTNLKSAIIKSA